ncbi:PaaI family thioesterase [Paroceanicella profunda]|uniref:PaaI family thioesterase n=1 Tax=Paroceanicella profunda TaxID=2579971 RepID=A0A5B8FG18_9RHOB|nr:PaaI family thioesterase [Paroceanicella profunda]QDL90587.1 PaaI family thioesterase [Paroceanicella profunda]
MTAPLTARSEADLLPREAYGRLSGLEIMTEMLEGRVPAPAIAGTLGFRVSEVAEGRVVFAGTPDFSVTNPMGTVHGGWYGALLDSCMACAVMTCLKAGTFYTTLEYKVNIIRPIPLGTEVFAIGKAHHAGRSTGIADGRMEDAGGKLYATGSTTCIVMKA